MSGSVVATAGLPHRPWEGHAVLVFERSAWFSSGSDGMLVLAGSSLSAAPAGVRWSSDRPVEDLNITPQAPLKFDGNSWTLSGRPLAVVSSIEDPCQWPARPRITARVDLEDRWSHWVNHEDAEWRTLHVCSALLTQLKPQSPRVVDLVASLIGRGSGSTPSGDDFLAGWWAGLLRQGHHPAAARMALKSRMIETTRLSRHFLSHALEGRFDRSIVKLADRDDLPADDDPEVLALTAQGDRSGRAVFLGFLTALEQGA